METIKKHFASVGLLINGLLLISIGIVGLHDFAFVGWSEFFSGGGRLWDLAYRLCLAYISSYVFYFLVVHLKRLRDEENIRPFLVLRTKRIVLHSEQLIEDFKKASGIIPQEEYPSRSEVEDMSRKISPHSQAPLLLMDRQTRANWLQYLKDNMDRTKREIATLYTVTPFLDSEYLRLLVEIDTCPHFESLLSIFALPIPIGNPDLSAWADGIYEYLELIKALKQWGATRLLITDWFNATSRSA